MSSKSVPIALFRLGHIVATPNALAQLTQEDITTAIQRHQAGDWGELDAHDRRVNERGLLEGDRLVSVYQSPSGVRYYVITEHDRSVTTVLLPEDY
jgi:hypothetical protein